MEPVEPLLVLVSKSDVWQKLIGEDFSAEPYLEPTPATGKLAIVDAARIHRVSDKIRSWLRESAPDVVAAAEDACKHVVYVPVSALGCSPQRQNDALVVDPADIHPRWVSVPLVYAFAMWSTGLVAARTS